jgi:hypothetical protein
VSTGKFTQDSGQTEVPERLKPGKCKVMIRPSSVTCVMRPVVKQRATGKCQDRNMRDTKTAGRKEGRSCSIVGA